MAVKDIIKSRRIELNLTMKDVAEKVGVSEATISRWESGDIENMKRDKIMSLAKALRISPAVIMGWDEEEDQRPMYYDDPEKAQIAQRIFEDSNLRILFDATDGARPEDLQMAAEMLKRFKEARGE